MGDLIDPADTPNEPHDGDCPECGSDNTLRSAEVADDASIVAPWCDDCGHGWFASNEE